MEVAPGSLAVWSDIGCPWSHAVVWRLHDARRRLGLEDHVVLDHHAFPLELFNSEATPRPRIEAEWPVARVLAPRAGWQAWAAPDHAWPVTMLPAMEAVQAAKRQSLAAAEALDRGLRRAFFGESRCVSLRHVILEVATEADVVDVALLAETLDAGTARGALYADWATARGDEVRGSAHVFAPDGTSAQNPGIEIDWRPGGGEGTYVVTRDDPDAIEDLVRRAARS
ncbi:MAG: DsbA family protein [Chloroflexi bacterium]|nr:DsbA family protein [Chloroflexota bacterium]